MATNRRGGHYKKYLDAYKTGQQHVPIPPSTWRRWYVSGRISAERLKELGIDISRRRNRRNKQQPAAGIPVIDQLPLSSSDSADNDRFDTLPCGAEETTPESRHSDSDTDRATDSVSEQDGFESNEEMDLDDDDIFGSFDSGTGSFDDNVINRERALASILSSKFIGPDILNQPLHPNLNITKFEVLMIILHLAMRHKMTNKFIEHLFQFVNKIVGIPDGLGMSGHLFHKLFKFGEVPTPHYFCPACNIYLGTNKTFPSGIIECEKEECEWSSTVSSHNDSNYFLILGIRDQIRDVLTKPGIKMVEKQRLEQVISDIIDGKEYRSKKKSGKVLSNPNSLTLTFNTDGAPVFKSGPNSLWPVYFLINEIEPSQRYRPDNLVLGGLWFGKCEANLQMFLKPIVDELKDLQTFGVVWRQPDGTVVESPVYLMCCCTDSVARPKVQHHMQFNGEYACGFCLHPNESITVLQKVPKRRKKGSHKKKKQVSQGNDRSDSSSEEEWCPKKVMRYVRGDYEMRTNKGLREHMQLAAVSQYHNIMGSTGVSVLCELKHFNVVYGFVIDYMHAVLLGTMKRLANIWFDSTSKGNPYYIGRSVDIVDSKIISVTLPSGFRAPRPISDRVHWKANEWRAFLLYYGLPVLANTLPDDYLSHFKKLVTAIYTLSKESILHDEINDAHKLLQDFVWEYQDLYGEINMVYNVHITSHLAQVVSRMGPVWAYSAFPFESANGRLVKLAMGTTGVASQISRKFIMTNNAAKLLCNGYQISDDTANFCSGLIGYEYLKHSSKGSNGETMLGRQFYYNLNDTQKQAFTNVNIPVCDPVLAFNRVVAGGKLYHSRLTTKQKVACDSCVRLISGEFALIDLVLKCWRFQGGPLTETMYLVTKLNIALDPSPLMASHIKQCSVESFGEIKLISTDEISRKCIFYSSCDRNYVAEITNFYETD